MPHAGHGFIQKTGLRHKSLKRVSSTQRSANCSTGFVTFRSAICGISRALCLSTARSSYPGTPTPGTRVPWQAPNGEGPKISYDVGFLPGPVTSFKLAQGAAGCSKWLGNSYAYACAVAAAAPSHRVSTRRTPWVTVPA
eukprot:3299020-Rhodomonas_salina.1